MAVGCGLLLIIPRTTILGALISLADMSQVDTLNMTLRCAGQSPESIEIHNRLHKVL